MNIQKNVALAPLLTMKIGGSARYYAEAVTSADIAELYDFAHEKNLPVWILGGGSNTLAHDQTYPGLVIKNNIKGIEQHASDTSTITYTVGAGELWDDIVALTVQEELDGIAAMAMIPGTVGAAPVQNIGAYGQELADVFVSLEAYDTKARKLVTLDASACDFSYRHSIFRGSEQGRYCITSVTMRFTRTTPKPPYYKAIQQYITDNHQTISTQADLARVVRTIRSNKLPDPSVVANSGSFFKNAIVPRTILTRIQEEYPNVPFFEVNADQVKIPTGWLIEKSGLKGYTAHGFAVHDKNCLVLKNISSSHYRDLSLIRQHIIDTVAQKFDIIISQEPLEITSTK